MAFRGHRLVASSVDSGQLARRDRVLDPVDGPVPGRPAHVSRDGRSRVGGGFGGAHQHAVGRQYRKQVVAAAHRMSPIRSVEDVLGGEQMQVVMCEAYGGPESLVIKSIASPSPGPTEVKIRLRARGVSYTDVLRIAGQYHVKTPPPFVPGGEAAGEIVQLGCDVKGFNLGDRVLCGGGFAEETVEAAGNVIKLPDTVSFEAAAAFRSNYMTAYYGLQRGRLRAGETLLVQGAAGGVGLATVDVGKLMGARVIATARSPERLEACKRLGADHIIDYSQGFREKVLALTGGRGADIIFDPVGGDVFDESMRCVAPFGRILIVGFTGGRPGLAKTNHLLVKDAEVIGFTIGALNRLDPQWAKRNLDALLGWLGANRISPYHSHALPLTQAATALKLIIERKAIGKVLLL
jgi:NADPH2:quinone reductase